MANFEVENENSGLLFEVNSENEKAPDYSGVINVEGNQYEIALWEKEFKNGVGFGARIKPVSEEDERPVRKSGGSSSSRGSQRRGKPTR